MLSTGMVYVLVYSRTPSYLGGVGLRAGASEAIFKCSGPKKFSIDHIQILYQAHHILLHIIPVILYIAVKMK